MVGAVPRESQWSGSVLAGPVTVQPPTYHEDDSDFTARFGFAHQAIGDLDAGIELGYIYFGSDRSGVDFSDLPRGRETRDSFDATLAARWHPNAAGMHPYLAVGTGAYAVQGYFPNLNSDPYSRRIKPGIFADVGVHGIVRPTLGLEVRWLTIYEVVGLKERNQNILNVLFSLTKE